MQQSGKVKATNAMNINAPLTTEHFMLEETMPQTGKVKAMHAMNINAP